MSRARATAFALAALLGLAGPARAADDESAVAEAIAHYDQGRYAEALAAFEPAAAGGSAAARFHLGLMHARGQGVAKDLAAAARWFEAAAEVDHHHAQFLVGQMYARGEGVARDPVRAHFWLTEAAANGWWKAREARERLVDGGMTPQEVAAAMKLHRDWKLARRAAAQ